MEEFVFGVQEEGPYLHFYDSFIGFPGITTYLQPSKV